MNEYVNRSYSTNRFDDKGAAWLAGTRIKVIEVALDHLAHGWSPEEIFFRFERRLPPAGRDEDNDETN